MPDLPMLPVVLPPNQFPHFYRGGARIAAFRGAAPDPSGMTPEDWVASTTTRWGSDHLGLSRLPDGRLLRDAIGSDPRAWLGEEHIARHGTNLAVLVKLLDAGQRLVVHAHPDRGFAAEHLHCAFGKTEAWLVLDAEDDAAVYVGFADDVDPEVLRAWVREQDSRSMLAALNRLDVRAGDAVLVPAGLPHAVGAGVFVIELQEPTDFSLLLEWEGFDVDPADGELGLGQETALAAVDLAGWEPARVSRLRGPGLHAFGSHGAGPDESGSDAPGGSRLLPPAADPFFRATLLRDRAQVDAGPCVLVVTDGAGELVTEAGRIVVHRGETLMVPYAAGGFNVAGEVEIVCCSPGNAGATDGPARPLV